MLMVLFAEELVVFLAAKAAFANPAAAR